MSIFEIFDKYYEDLTEVFNEKIDETLPEYRPYNCKIELEPDTPLYKGALYSRSEREKIIKEYIEENLVKGFIGRSESPVGYFVFRTQEFRGITTMH